MFSTARERRAISLPVIPVAASLAGRMHEDFRASHGVGAGDLGVEDFLGGDRRDTSQRRVRHRKYAVLAVQVQVGIPHVEGRGGIQRNHAPIAQYDLAGRIDEKAGLKEQLRKGRVGFIAIARQVNGMASGNPRQFLVFLAFRVQRRIVPPLLDRRAQREAGQRILGQHDEPRRLPDVLERESAAPGNRTRRALEVPAHQLARLLPGLALADRQRAGLQRKRRVSIQISHGAIMAAQAHSCKQTSLCSPIGSVKPEPSACKNYGRSYEFIRLKERLFRYGNEPERG